MRGLRRFFNRFFSFASKRQTEERLHEEIAGHLASQIADNIRSGMSEAEARRQAFLKFGAVESMKEEYRAERSFIFVETLLRDIRFALRILRKSPGFTAVAVLTLALGIGANTAIFGLANAAFFRALPYPHADRLAVLWKNNPRTGVSEGSVSYPDWADWRAQSRSFEDMAFIDNTSTQKRLVSNGSGYEHVAESRVSANFFSVLGVSPILGRSFAPDDALRGEANVVIISYALWRSIFAGDPHAIGRQLGFGESETVIGVMPPNFSFPPGTDMWIPLEVNDYMRTKSRQYQLFKIIGRVKPGVKFSSAQAEMNTIALRLALQYPAIDGGVGIRIVPLREQLSQNIRQGLLVLWGAVFGVLLIACVNAANLMMARASGRQKEIAVRFSLGATRGRIIRQFLAESLLLASAGALAGFFLAFWTLAMVSKFNPDIANLDGGVFDARVLLYTIAVTAFTALLCGVLPAFSASGFDLNRALKESSSGAASPGTHFIRKILIVAEVSLAFVLLVGSGLLIRSLSQILSINPGFDADHVLALDLRFPQAPPNLAPDLSDKKNNALYADLMARLRALPGVVSVSSASNVLFPIGVSCVIEGRPSASEAQRPFLHNTSVTPDYFRTMGIPLLRGRLFNDAEAAADAAGHPTFVTIINEAMARRYWPNGDPLGKRIRKYDPSREPPWFTIIGVVGDVRTGGLENSPSLMTYDPEAGDWGDDDLLIRTAGSPVTLIPAVRDEVHEVDKTLAIYSVTPVSAMLSKRESQRKFNAWLLGAFAFIALLLAAVGVYGSISYWVKQRTQEIGIRMALGAQPKNIFALVIGRGMAVIFVGLALGIAGALALTRLISTMLFGVRPEDPITYTAVAVLLAAVALAACYFPARRAMRVDPLVALRYE
jgi:predicted permease